MSTNSRIKNGRVLSRFTLTSREFFLRLNFISNKFLNMMSNSFFQSLGRSTYVHTITVAQVQVNKSLSFHDVLVEKSNKKFITSVYKKPTFTGQYTRWDSFESKRKTNLIGTLVHRALEIALLKSSKVKSTKSKIFCDRMDTQKKSLSEASHSTTKGVLSSIDRKALAISFFKF